MLNRREAIRILNTEKNYEEQIAEDILGFLDFSLAAIENITQEERDFIRKNLSRIRNESIVHSKKFTELIKYCVEDGKDNY